jgi:signal transduction histidine kinase
MPERHNEDVGVSPVSRAPGGTAPGRQPRRSPARSTAAAAGLAVLRAVARAPFTGRAWRELLYCLLGLPFIVFLPFVGFFVVIAGAQLAAGPWVTHGNPSGLAVLAAVAAAGLLALLLVTTGATRALAGVCRDLARWLLGERVTAPPPRRAGLDARLRDGAGWRALAYLLVKVPVAVLGGWAVVIYWGAGLVNLTYPFWWRQFRNHSPGVHLSPVPVVTPFGWFPGTFRVATFPGTFAAFAAGVAMLLAAPWVTRAVVSVDRWLIRGLLGPGSLAQRLRDLEQTRALAVDDAAAQLRSLERNLHDGAQIRLATLAMNLGMARKKLGTGDEVLDIEAVRELVGAAHQGAKDALAELRELARGIHPAVLDNGLADALASLAAGNAIPAELAVSIPVRPTPAIESIAYFCAAELLANATKHSEASKIEIDVTGEDRVLVLRVTDDGRGGADPDRGTGLAGLAQRVSTVDGRLEIGSPPGGPTRVTVELPLRA